MDEPVRPPPPFLLDRRRFLLAAAGGASALALGACRGSRRAASGPHPTVRLPVGAFGFPSPFASNGGPGYAQMSLLYDTLLWKDGSGRLLPWLAKSHTTSDDHLTHTFELRDGATWSDGRPITAADVRFTFEYYDAQTLPPPIIIQAPDGIAKVAAPGPRTVEITLEKPLVTFAEQVAGALPIVPEHVWSPIDDAPEAQDPKILVGSGAYRLDLYEGDGDALLYLARDDYFLGRPYVGRIESNGSGNEFTALLSGTIDVAHGMGERASVLAPFKGNPDFGMVTQQGNSTTALYFNLAREGALGDARFRRACAMAIDRRDIVARLADGNGRPGNPGFLGPENPFLAEVPQHELDVAGANHLLDAAGYPIAGNGIRQGPKGPLSFELLVGNLDIPMAEILVGAGKRIGVELRPKGVELGPALFGTKLVGGYEMALLFYAGPTAGGPNADPDILRQLFSSASPPSLSSASEYRNPAFDTLADKQQTTFDESERKAIVAEMQRILAEDVPVLPLYYPESVLVFRKGPLDEWYFTPGQYPITENNKQLFITGRRSGTEIRPVR